MNPQQQMDLQQQFESAISRVDNLPGDQAAPHMTELYGLYKQATEGDHDTKGEVVGDDSPDNPSGEPGMSQAQWDSWSKYKGVSEDDAKRQYIDKVNQIVGPNSDQSSVQTESDQAPTNSQATVENTTISQQPGTGPGVSTGGLRGDITAGAPYGGEDKLKGDQEVI
jgi:acyl-CoA-binding protein